MAGEAAKSHRLTIFGLQVLDENGDVVKTTDGTAHTYFRNMTLEFIGRHYPDVLLKFFPEITSPWRWGKCLDLQGFRTFAGEHFSLRLNEDGSASILTKKPIEEVVFEPNKFKRRQITDFSHEE